MMQLTDGEAPVLVNGLVELDHAGNEPVVVSAQVDASRRFPQYGRDIDSRNSPSAMFSYMAMASLPSAVQSSFQRHDD